MLITRHRTVTFAMLSERAFTYRNNQWRNSILGKKLENGIQGNSHELKER